MPMGIQTARDKVRIYCSEHGMRQGDFLDMIPHITKSTFSRFMGAGNETTGKGSLAFPAIKSFFAKEKRANEKLAREYHEKLALKQYKQYNVVASTTTTTCTSTSTSTTASKEKKRSLETVSNPTTESNPVVDTNVGFDVSIISVEDCQPVKKTKLEDKERETLTIDICA